VIGAIVGEWIGSTRRHRRPDHPGHLQLRLALLYATMIVGSGFSASLLRAIVPGWSAVVIRWQPPKAPDLEDADPNSGTHHG
jgi:hypothetical protein